MKDSVTLPTVDACAQRTLEYPIDPLFVRRWSPRAFDGGVMSEADLFSIFEAARWAPSAYNLQPWRFLYALRGDAYWIRYLALLDEFNLGWARHASALVFVLSDRMMPAYEAGPPQPSPTHSFDTGAAALQFALQATVLGYQAHAMAGIHYEVAREQLMVPHQYKVEIALAVGRQADAAVLSPELQAREFPSERRPLTGTAFAGRFPSEASGDSVAEAV